MANDVTGAVDLDRMGSAGRARPSSHPSGWERLVGRALSAHAGLVTALGALLGLVIAAVVTAVSPPTYHSTMEVLVRPTTAAQDAGSAYQADLLANALAKPYSHLMTGEVVAREVITALSLGESVTTFQSKVQAAPLADTAIITVTVADPSSSRAARIADTIVRQFNSYLTTLAGPSGTRPTANVVVVEPASVPPSPDQPKATTNLAIGLVIGALFGAAVASSRSRWHRRTAGRDAEHGAGDELRGDGLPRPLNGHVRRMPTPSRSPAEVRRGR